MSLSRGVSGAGVVRTCCLLVCSAAFAAGTACAPAAQGAATQAEVTKAADLTGTSWRLVRFEGGDDTIVKPADPSRYTIEFGKDGQLTAQIDCNRGRGTWKSSEPSLIEFGPLALTRAICPDRSLHDRMVKHWPYFRSYVIRDGDLFLALMADGGIYQFERVH